MVGPLLVLGAHPDDIEFGCGGVVGQETRRGRAAHFVVCSRGESATNGTPEQRTAEAEAAAGILGATIEWLDLGGDAHFERRMEHTMKMARIIRRVRPAIVLAPTTVDNQHPDHAVLGHVARDAARLARYGGVAELKDVPVHAIGQFLYYAVSPDAEPREISPVFVDVSAEEVIEAWTKSMEAHASQMQTRGYVDMQLTRAKHNGARAGVGHAIALFPCDPPVFESLAALERGARRF